MAAIKGKLSVTVQRFKLELSLSKDGETGELMAAYLRVRGGKSVRVKRFAGGNGVADYDSDGNLLGIEVLGPCSVADINKIVRKEPSAIKILLANSIAQLGDSSLSPTLN